MDNLCYMGVIAVSILSLVFGFFELLKRPQSGETDASVIQRQLRGFGFIMLSQLIFFVGSALCYGFSGGIDDLKAIIRGTRM